jgi:hypothetical protein
MIDGMLEKEDKGEAEYVSIETIKGRFLKRWTMRLDSGLKPKETLTELVLITTAYYLS